MIRQIEVENIKGSGCANSIERALLKIAGVDNVTVDTEHGIIVVEGNAERHRLIEELTDLGYPEKGSNTPLSKAKSYFSCDMDKIE